MDGEVPVGGVPRPETYPDGSFPEEVRILAQKRTWGSTGGRGRDVGCLPPYPGGDSGLAGGILRVRAHCQGDLQDLGMGGAEAGLGKDQGDSPTMIEWTLTAIHAIVCVLLHNEVETASGSV